MCTNICFECINLFRRSFLVRTLPAYGNYMCLFTCTADLSLSKSFHGYFFLLLVLFFKKKEKKNVKKKQLINLREGKKNYGYAVWVRIINFWNSEILCYCIILYISSTLMNNMGKNVHIYMYYLSLVSVAFGLPGVLALLFLHKMRYTLKGAW